MRPVRSMHQATVLVDPWSGEPLPTGRCDVVHGIEGRRWLRSATVVHTPACVCGCVAPPAGLCVICRDMGGTGLVCGRCFAQCARCRKPVCPAHSVPDRCNGASNLRLCRVCGGDACRARIVRGVMSLLISPFVERTNGTR
ncbi:hypothetical protein PHYC_02041 [Phycisphaerales bacterium]|nr:hypothetical protein PHYC_02041 [Phycisphaerales bacterium]